MVVDYHNFPSKLCSFIVPQKFVKETLCASETSWEREMLEIREGISQFSVKIVLSHSYENFRGETIWF